MHDLFGNVQNNGSTNCQTRLIQQHPLSYEALVAKKSAKKKNPILVHFAKKVRSRRYELGLTQEQLDQATVFL
jgi:hypothetical protein